jgi:membrane associated rhomboid family serine protease
MRNLPPICKNLLLLNIIVWLFDMLMERFGISLTTLLGLHYFTADSFYLWQPITYMFMHANFQHIFFNMFALFMFGPALEEYWGSKRFLIYYLVCGLGAALVQEGVWAIKMMNLLDTYSATSVQLNYTNVLTTIGASGSVLVCCWLSDGYSQIFACLLCLFLYLYVRAHSLPFMPSSNYLKAWCHHREII